VARGIEIRARSLRHRIAGERQYLRRPLADNIADASSRRLAVLVPPQNLVQEIPILLAAALELALQVAADPPHLVLVDRRVSYGGHLLEHARHEAVDLGRVAGPLDPDAILRLRVSTGLRFRGNGVRGAELLANGVA